MKRPLEEAQRWWQDNRAEARYTIKDELARASTFLARFPYLGTRCHNAKLRDVRRVHLGRIRYDLYYRVRRGRVELLALWHSRGSGPDL